MQEIPLVFKIPVHFKEFNCLNPSEIPCDQELFHTFEIDKISHLAKFYGSMSWVAIKTFPRLVDAEGVRNKYPIFKGFVFLKQVEYETQAAADLAIAEDNL